jgi:hypothetical protein
MTPVKSSNLEAVHHEGSTLSIRFKGGAVWDYQDVPKELHDRMMAAHDAGDSIGRFFHANIRHQFKATKRETPND